MGVENKEWGCEGQKKQGITFNSDFWLTKISMIYFLMVEETSKSSTSVEFLKMLSNFIREIQTNSSIYKTTMAIMKSMTSIMKNQANASHVSLSLNVRHLPSIFHNKLQKYLPKSSGFKQTACVFLSMNLIFGFFFILTLKFCCVLHFI